MTRQAGGHLTQIERCQISLGLCNDYSQREIAEQTGLNQSVICRELKRNSTEGLYEPEQAQKNAELRRSVASSRLRKMTPEIEKLIRYYLVETDASPVQMAGRLALEHDIQISHMSIYRFMRKHSDLHKHFRHPKPYNWGKGKKAGCGLIPNRVDIDERPLIVEAKERFGDLELDTIVGAGHRGSIVSIVDRVSKFVWLILVPRATAECVCQAIQRCLFSLAMQGLMKTSTSDNGSEFARHAEIAKALYLKFFFAKPYHSWERGLNEHTNGLFRQYFPKGTDFTKLTQKQVDLVADKLNNRPRQALEYMTPLECAQALVAAEGGDFYASF